MVQLIMQFLIILSLVGGIVIGEAIATNVFGSNKKWYINVLEMVLFITVITIIMGNIYLPEDNYLLIGGINFFMGLTTILASRGVTTSFGFLSNRIKEKCELKNKLTEDTYIIGLTRNLLTKGLNLSEVKRVLKNSGFNPKKINKASGLFKEDNKGKSSQEEEGTKRNN